MQADLGQDFTPQEHRGQLRIELQQLYFLWTGLGQITRFCQSKHGLGPLALERVRIVSGFGCQLFRGRQIGIGQRVKSGGNVHSSCFDVDGILARMQDLAGYRPGCIFKFRN